MIIDTECITIFWVSYWRLGMNSKKEKELEHLIEDALKHEENLQHDQNEEPVTFAKKTDDKKQE